MGLAAASIRPQLAKLPTKTTPDWSELVERPDWTVQRKWDGMRALFHVIPPDGDNPGRTLIFSRTGQDLRPQFPELTLMHTHFEDPAILDGEIVALRPDNPDHEDLERLQLRLGDKKARRLSDIPVEVRLFDVLSAKLNGTNVVGSELPLSERLAVLRLLLADTPYELPVELEAGADIPAHWEGVVAKNADSLYAAGKRNSNWLKFKATLRATLRATGYTEGKGARAGSFGALLVEDANGVPRGQVGSGFSDSQIAEILEWGNWWLHSEKADWPLVEVEYRFLSKTGLMVNTAFKGARVDKDEADDLS